MDVPPTTPSVFTSLSTSLSTFLRAELQREEGSRVSNLYQHQIEAALDVSRHFADPHRPRVALVVLPTGGGKTGVAVLSAYMTNSARVLVITPSVKVSNQIAAAFAKPAGGSFLYDKRVVQDAPEQRVLPVAHVIEGNDLATPESRALVLRHSLVVTNVHKVGARGDQSRVSLQDIPRDFDLVIVDEAHHYPAKTWKAFVNHFDNANRIFLTGTPKYRGGPILTMPDVDDYQRLCLAHELTRDTAIMRSIIRRTEFCEVNNQPTNPNPIENDFERAAFRGMAREIRRHLALHDQGNPNIWHQAMVLSQTIEDINPALAFVEEYNRDIPMNTPREKAMSFIAGDNMAIVNNFQEGQKFRVLVVVGRLLEGFDHSPVSVVGIARNVRSGLLFEQFVGRAVRRTGPGDIDTACIVTHTRYNQRRNYNLIDVMRDEEDEEEDV